jgi:hypothetical protein
MPFQVSPGVNVSEIDLTTVVPAVSTTEGALAGIFRWGPVSTRVLVDSESTLVTRFGKPTNLNAETFFTAANFLSYGNKLYTVRTANTTDATGVNGVLSAYANVGAVTTNTNLIIKSDADIDNETVLSNIAGETNVRYIARYPGALGNSLKISVCDTSEAYFANVQLTNADANLSSNGSITNISVSSGANQFSITIGPSGTGVIGEAVDRLTAVKALLTVGDLVELGNSTIGTQLVKVTSIGSVTNTASIATLLVNTEAKYTLLSINGTGSANVNSITAGYLKRYWEYANVVDAAPGPSDYQASYGGTPGAIDEVHVVVVDENGQFTGIPGAVLEVYEGLSRASDAKSADGAS